jgi:hypothetical protein
MQLVKKSEAYQYDMTFGKFQTQDSIVIAVQDIRRFRITLFAGIRAELLLIYDEGNLFTACNMAIFTHFPYACSIPVYSLGLPLS